MGTKILTYIEAEIPVIVMNEKRSQSNFVEKHNLGFSINNNDLKDLYKLIKTKSYSTFKKDILKFNKNNNFENYNNNAIEAITNLIS